MQRPDPATQTCGARALPARARALASAQVDGRLRWLGLCLLLSLGLVLLSGCAPGFRGVGPLGLPVLRPYPR